jgi:hypothetical protein
LGMHYPGMGEKAVIAITLRAILVFIAKSTRHSGRFSYFHH